MANMLASASVELSGHLIDSLTLAKVIDRIQTAQCEYTINEIRIGEEKRDLSYAHISVWTDSDITLYALLEDLKAYGVKAEPFDSAATAPAPADGQVPEQAFTLNRIPEQILIFRNWISIDASEAEPAVLVADEANKQVHICRVRDVKHGDPIIIGYKGIKYRNKP